MSLRTIARASITLLAVAIGTAIAAPTPTKPTSPKAPSNTVDPSQTLLSLPDAKVLLGTAAKLQPKLTVKAKAEMMVVSMDQIAPPFTLSARKPYEASRGHLTAISMNLLAVSDQLSAIDSPENSYVLARLVNLQANKRVLAECSVGAGLRSGTARLQVAELGASASQAISRGQNRNVVLLFTPTSATHTLQLKFDGGPWGFYGCTFTPQR